MKWAGHVTARMTEMRNALKMEIVGKIGSYQGGEDDDVVLLDSDVVWILRAEDGDSMFL
jgi:hypothetical protein